MPDEVDDGSAAVSSVVEGVDSTGLLGVSVGSVLVVSAGADSLVDGAASVLDVASSCSAEDASVEVGQAEKTVSCASQMVVTLELSVVAVEKVVVGVAAIVEREGETVQEMQLSGSPGGT